MIERNSVKEFWVSLATRKIIFKLKETLKQFTKIKKEIMINHKVTSMVKDGEDWHWLQIDAIVKQAKLSQDAQTVT